jgi:aspartokinase-like uncharacterized kinase
MSMAGATLPLVVAKIGGSLLTSPGLDPLLRRLVGPNGARVVIVPGGGPFADAVRDMQERLKFDDGLAHRLALDAMGHVAEILAARNATFVAAGSVETIAQAHRQGRVPIWLPTGLRKGHRDIPENWSVTSDSLAAWLAAQLKADSLVLCKSADIAASGRSRSIFASLAAAGIVDEAFPDFAMRYGGPVRVFGPAQHGHVDPLLGLAITANHAS